MHVPAHDLYPDPQAQLFATQAWLAPQLPQEMVPPHWSLMLPHVLPCAPQVVGVQPHAFAVPLPPQVCGGVQLPHCSVPLQPSDTLPQLAPACAQVLAVHGVSPHLPAMLPPQYCPAGHEPQSRRLPQPSLTEPHCTPSSTHVPALHPHWLGLLPPPHT